MRHALWLLLALACGCLPVPRSSVVGIQDGSGQVICSAFAVEGPKLITAAHCVHGRRVRYVTLELWSRTVSASMIAQLDAIDPVRDWAKLRPESAQGLAELSIGAQPNVGETIRSVAARNDWRVAQGQVTSSFFVGIGPDGVDQHRWDSTMTVQPGWSGSPIINDRGEAIGILTGCRGTALWRGTQIAKSCLPGNSLFVELPNL